MRRLCMAKKLIEVEDDQEVVLDDLPNPRGHKYPHTCICGRVMEDCEAFNFHLKQCWKQKYDQHMRERMELTNAAQKIKA